MKKKILLIGALVAAATATFGYIVYRSVKSDDEFDNLFEEDDSFDLDSEDGVPEGEDTDDIED